MPWYISPVRLTACGVYLYFAYVQSHWIMTAEDRYRRSLTWKPAVGTLIEHKIVLNKLGASHVWYKFEADGVEYTGDRFKSGGVNVEEHLKNPTLLGVGTQLVVYYNPEEPKRESAIKIAADRPTEFMFALNILLCLTIAYRSVRCETLWPNMVYRFLHSNRRLVEPTGMRQQRTHNMQKPKYGKGFSSAGGFPSPPQQPRL